MEQSFKGHGLSLRAALVMDSRMGAIITRDKAQNFPPEDKNTLMITAVYYQRQDIAQTMLESGADLSARNFEACHLACKNIMAHPQSAKAQEIMGIVAHWAKIQDIDLAAIRHAPDQAAFSHLSKAIFTSAPQP